MDEGEARDREGREEGEDELGWKREKKWIEEDEKKERTRWGEEKKNWSVGKF